MSLRKSLMYSAAAASVAGALTMTPKDALTRFQASTDAASHEAIQSETFGPREQMENWMRGLLTVPVAETEIPDNSEARSPREYLARLLKGSGVIRATNEDNPALL